MKPQSTRLRGRIRIVGVIMIIGLLVELYSLHWAHPAALLICLLLGLPLSGIGIFLCLYALIADQLAVVRRQDPQPETILESRAGRECWEPCISYKSHLSPPPRKNSS